MGRSLAQSFNRVLRMWQVSRGQLRSATEYRGWFVRLRSLNSSLWRVKMAYGLDDIDLASLKVSKCSFFPLQFSFSCLNCRIAIDNKELIFWNLMKLLCRWSRFLVKWDFCVVAKALNEVLKIAEVVVNFMWCLHVIQFLYCHKPVNSLV